jgi:hypothetical protein
METLTNVLKEDTIKSLQGVADDVLSGNSGNHKVWTNLAWDPRIVQDSNTVICIAVPGSLVLEVEETLISLGIFNPKLHRPLIDSGAVSIYLWPNGSYIPTHKDSVYAQAVSVYLTKHWALSDGGLFCYVGDDGIRCVVPEYNTGVRNNKAEPHFTTPVTSDKIRVSLQIFMSYLENQC